MYLLFHLPVIEARGKPRFSCCVLLKWGHFSFIFSCCRKLAFPPLKYKCIFLLLGCFLLKQGFKAEVSGCSANILFSDLYVLSFPIETGFGASWGQILHQSLVKFLGIGCLNWFERGELNVQHPDLAKCMDRGCLSVRKSETTFLAENRIRACLLIQKKVVFVSEIKVWSCSWACKMPGASPSFPGSCNALIHQNQSHSHELVIRFLAASGQIMYFFLRAAIWALEQMMGTGLFIGQAASELELADSKQTVIL